MITLKLVMTGFAVWFAPGSLMQIVIGMLVLLIYAIILLHIKPYRVHTHNSMAVFQTLMVFLSLFASLLLKMGDVAHSSNVELGYSTAFITATLIVAALSILGVSVLGAIHDYQLAEDASHLEAKWTARLKEVSAKLVRLPREDPPEGAAFYAMKNPIDGKSNERKLEQLKALRTQNMSVLEAFFDTIDGRAGISCVKSASRVRPGHVLIRLNSKTDDATMGKAVRPSLLAEYPRYGLEHVRDFLRFKVVTSCIIDAFVFMDLLVSSADWKVVKFDIAK